MIGLGTVYLNNFVFANAFINMISNILFINYLSGSFPMNFAYLNQLELMNEITMLVFSYFFFLFTDYSGNVETRYLVGKYFIGFTVMMICVNVAIISNNLYTETLIDFKRKEAKEAWKSFSILKVKMAKFIVVNGKVE